MKPARAITGSQPAAAWCVWRPTPWKPSVQRKRAAASTNCGRKNYTHSAWSRFRMTLWALRGAILGDGPWQVYQHGEKHAATAKLTPETNTTTTTQMPDFEAFLILTPMPLVCSRPPGRLLVVICAIVRCLQRPTRASAADQG